MHELGITRNIVAIVGAAKARPVRRVTIEIGKLSGVMPDTIAFCFETVAKKHGAEQRRVGDPRNRRPGTLRRCGVEFSTSTLFAPCGCGSRRLAGEELNIKTLELEEAA